MRFLNDGWIWLFLRIANNANKIHAKRKENNLKAVFSNKFSNGFHGRYIVAIGSIPN
jgi:hypothetical protein